MTPRAVRVKYLISCKTETAVIADIIRDRADTNSRTIKRDEGFAQCPELGSENTDDKSHPAQMTSAKSAAPFRGEQKLGSLDRELQRKLRDREMLARSLARTLFAATSRRRDARKPVYHHVSWPLHVLRAAARSKIQTGRPANRSFCGIIFSIPTTSTVVAYNISRHINIPEGRRAAPRRPRALGRRTDNQDTTPVHPPRARSGVHLGQHLCHGGESESKDFWISKKEIENLWGWTKTRFDYWHQNYNDIYEDQNLSQGTRRKMPRGWIEKQRFYFWIRKKWQICQNCKF